MRFVLNVARGGGIGSRIFASLFGLVFAGVGFYFCGVLGSMLLKSYASWFWPTAECTIEESRFVERAADPAAARDSQPFRFEVRYRYEWQGAAHSGSVYRRGYDGGADAGEVERLVARFPAGAPVRCFVDPTAPETSVLARPPLAGPLILLFPLLFVGFGLAVVVSAWWRPRTADAGNGGPAVAALGRPDPQRWKSFGCMAAFFGVFAAFGLAFFLPMFAVPMWRMAKARGWTAVPCTIEASGLGTHSSSDGGPTYSVDVLYRYEIDGRAYKGSHYDLMLGSSSGREAKEAIVAALPAGTTTQCFVDPNDPTDSVLNRSFPSSLWIGLLPLLFVAVGVGGIAGSGIVTFRRRARGIGQWVPGVADGAAVPRDALGMAPAYEPTAPASASRSLAPSQSSLGKVGCAAFLALFVGGLVGAFVWKGVIEPWRAGARPDGCMLIILIPFALIALGLIVNLPYQILAFFNPRPHLELVPGILRVGASSRLRWRFSGLSGRLGRVTIVLEGHEEATHRVGTTTRTDTALFLRQAILDTADPTEIVQGGDATLALPPNVVHSFSAQHNKIRYKLKLHATVAGWPDVLDEFEIDVAPEGDRP